MYYFVIEVMFGPDGIVVASLAVTYLTLKSVSKVTVIETHEILPASTKWTIFDIDVVFGSDATVLKKNLLQPI